ncbi:MAG: hypothetical protein MK179_13525 [Pirellulaceae bacterium]|nr:hypothetical protein [Pirellulaceae bacterium]
MTISRRLTKRDTQMGNECPIVEYRSLWWLTALGLLVFTGCQSYDSGTPQSRPFPLGNVSDAFWETQQANAEAADFIFYHHEFRAKTAEVAPGTKRHLESVALRLEHVPFPVVIEQSKHDRYPKLDEKRRQVIVEHLTRMGVADAQERVIIAPSFVLGYSASEAVQAYYATFGNGGYGAGQGAGGFGRGFGGFGGGMGRRNFGTGGLYR